MFQANKVFTDRENFKDTLRKTLDSLSLDGSKKITTFYGAGGQGKSSICNELITKILPHYKERIEFIKIDIEAIDHYNHYIPLEFIRRTLGEKLKFKFTSFDIAFIKYINHAESNLDKSRYNYMYKFDNAVVNDSVDVLNELMEDVPGIRFIYNRLKKFGKDFYVKFLEGKTEILEEYKLDEIDAASIQKLLPVFLAYDLNNYLASKNGQKKVILIFDHYEKLWEDRANKKGHGSKAVDSWVNELYNKLSDHSGLIVFSRDRLKWGNIVRMDKSVLEQHYVGKLSNEDCDTFLSKIPIKEERIRKRIVKSSAGLPFYLDLQVDIYTDLMNNNEAIDIDKFGKETGDIIERFMAHIGDNEEENLKVLALSKRINEEIFYHLRSENYILKTRNFSSIIEHSFFEPLEETDGNFKMHNLMKSWLKNELVEHDKILFEEVNQTLFEFYNKKAEAFIQESIYDSEFDFAVREALYHLLTHDISKSINWLFSLENILIQNFKYDLAEDLFSLTASELLLGGEDDDYLIKSWNLAFSLLKVLEKRAKNVEIEELIRSKLFVFISHPEQFTEELYEQLKFEPFNIQYSYTNSLIANNKFSEAKRWIYPTRSRQNNDVQLNTLLRRMGQLDLAESILWNVYIYQLKNEESGWKQSVLYNFAGNVLFDSKRYDQAISYYERSLDKSLNEEPENKAVALYCLGKAHSIKNPELGNKYLTEAKDIYNEIYRTDHPYFLLTKLKIAQNNIAISGIENRIGEIQDHLSQYFQQNPYDPANYVHIHFVVKHIFELDATFATFLLKTTLEIVTFKYGPHFHSLLPLLELAREKNISLSRNIDQWISNIENVNQFRIRTAYFEEKKISETLRKKYIDLIESNTELPSDRTIKFLDLPFYKTYFLAVIAFSNKELYAFSNGQELLFINGSNEHFYRQMSSDFIFESENLDKYVRLFFDCVNGRHGRFTFLESESDLSWSSCQIDLEESAELKKQVGHTQFKERTSEIVVFSTKSLYFKNSLFEADINVDSNGQVEINNEKERNEGFTLEYEVDLDTDTSLHAKLRLLERLFSLIDDSESEAFRTNIRQINKSAEQVLIYASSPLPIEEFRIISTPSDYLNKVQEELHDEVDVECYELPFSSEFSLVRIFNPVTGQTALFFTDFNERNILIDGRAKGFYNIVNENFNRSPDALKDYVKLFCDQLNKDEGHSFPILENPDKYAIIPLEGENEKIEEVLQLIKPIKLIEDNEDQTIFETRSIFHRNNIYEATLKVDKNTGYVTMLDDEPILDNVLVIAKEQQDDAMLLVKAYNRMKEQLGTGMTKLDFNKKYAWLTDLLFSHIISEIEEDIANVYDK